MSCAETLRSGTFIYAQHCPFDKKPCTPSCSMYDVNRLGCGFKTISDSLDYMVQWLEEGKQVDEYLDCKRVPPTK